MPWSRRLLLTAQRRDEIAQMSRKEIGEDAIWEIPAERYKTKRSNFVPLSKAALPLIEAQPKIEIAITSFRRELRRLSRASARARPPSTKPFLRR